MWIPVTIEIVLVAVLLSVSCAMLRNRLAVNLIGTGFRTVSFFGNCLIAFGIFRISIAGFGSVIGCLLFSLLLSSAVTNLAMFFLRRSAKEKKWRESLHDALHLPVWCDRLLSTVVVATLWFVCIFVASLAGECLAISPQGKSALQRTTLLRLLVDPDINSTDVAAFQLAEKQSDSADSGFAFQAAAAEQLDFFRRFAKGTHRIKKQMFEATGLDTVQREIELTRKIVNLPPEQKMWVLCHYPPLMEVVDHPNVVRILDNEALTARFERFADGSINEVFMIAADRNINALMDDRDFRDLVRRIDLEEILREAQRGTTSTMFSAENSTDRCSRPVHLRKPNRQGPFATAAAAVVVPADDSGNDRQCYFPRCESFGSCPLSTGQ